MESTGTTLSIRSTTSGGPVLVAGSLWTEMGFGAMLGLGLALGLGLGLVMNPKQEEWLDAVV